MKGKLKQQPKSYCTAQRTISTLLGYYMMEDRMRKSIYMNSWVTMLYSRNWHNTVNQLHTLIKISPKPKTKKRRLGKIKKACPRLHRGYENQNPRQICRDSKMNLSTKPHYQLPRGKGQYKYLINNAWNKVDKEEGNNVKEKCKRGKNG